MTTPQRKRMDSFRLIADCINFELLKQDERTEAKFLLQDIEDFVKYKRLKLEACKIKNGLCLTHGFSVSEKVKCPRA